MLSLAKLKPGQQAYYLEMVARGVEDYYVGGSEAPGEWIGTAAGSLGLAGAVEEEALGRVLSHCDPKDGTRLTRAQGAPRVAGFDATFNVPKSVSLLFALGTPDVSAAVADGHDAAVHSAFRFLESVAARGRRGKGGVDRIDGDGLLGAAFRHRTSRAADPHLHTHVLVANLVHSPEDGRWSALDARPVYGWARPVGCLHEAQLRAELTRRLGVEWGPVRQGTADIAGIPRTTLLAFSRRRVEIEAQLAAWGGAGPAAAQAATYATRAPKDPEASAERLDPEWRRRATAVGFDADAIAAVIGRGGRVHVPAADSAEAEALFAALAGQDGVTARASTFGRREVLQAICAALPNGGDIPDIVALADGFLVSEHVLALDRPVVLRAADVIRRGDGRLVVSYADEARFTTPEMLTVEADLLASAARRQGAGVAIAGAAAVRTAMSERVTLASEQLEMVVRICRSGAGVDVVEGVAGAGKTFALDAARAAWEASGYRVIGCALAARAAAELEAGTAIPSMTLDRLLAYTEQADSGGLGSRTVVVVDEAAMVGTRKLARLLHHAEVAGAKVVLVGDRHQLPAIDAGGAFAALAERLEVVRLDQNRRQAEPWERQALADLRAGEVDSALDAYTAHGRIHGQVEPYEQREELVERWWAAREAGKPAAMIAARRREVEELNRLARRVLHAHGRLGSDILIGETVFAVGDEVVATRNDYRLGVLNGTRGQVHDIDSGGAVSVKSERGTIDLPAAYAAEHLVHAYATTVHRAQGTTVERALVVGDNALHHESGYAALSRGSERNDIFLTSTLPDADIHLTPDLGDLREGLRAGLARSLAPRLATDLLPSPKLLAAERRGIEADLRAKPPDHRRTLRYLADQRDSLRTQLVATRSHREHLEAKLDARSWLGRTARGQDRRTTEKQLALVREHEADVVQRLDGIEDRAATIREAQQQHDDWVADHPAELMRLRMIERVELFVEQLAERGTAVQHDWHVARPKQTPGAEIDTGLSV